MAISMLKIRRPLGRLIFNMGIAIPGKTVFLIETAPRSIAALHTYTNEGGRDMGLSECPYLRAHLNDQFGTLLSMTATLLHTVRSQNDAQHETESKLRKLEAEVSCLKEDELSFTQILDQVHDADTSCAADMDDVTVPARLQGTCRDLKSQDKMMYEDVIRRSLLLLYF